MLYTLREKPLHKPGQQMYRFSAKITRIALYVQSGGWKPAGEGDITLLEQFSKSSDHAGSLRHVQGVHRVKKYFPNNHKPFVPCTCLFSHEYTVLWQKLHDMWYRNSSNKQTGGSSCLLSSQMLKRFAKYKTIPLITKFCLGRSICPMKIDYEAHYNRFIF